MEYITSRGFELPATISEMESHPWFNMWKKKFFPYSELLPGDRLYWFDTPKQQLVWDSIVTAVERYPYADKDLVLQKYPDIRGVEYYASRAKQGYFLRYEIRILARLNIPKPSDYNFPQKGWVRLDDRESRLWLQKPPASDVLLADLTDEPLDIKQLLRRLDKDMHHVTPERIRKLMEVVLRHDSKMVQMLKKAAEYKCQFPGCTSQIKTRKGPDYVEVAHIKAVSEGGKSVLSNLLVLCPNHHKEFDHGKNKIVQLSEHKIKGNLNGRDFEIDLIY